MKDIWESCKVGGKVRNTVRTLKLLLGVLYVFVFFDGVRMELMSSLNNKVFPCLVKCFQLSNKFFPSLRLTCLTTHLEPVVAHGQERFAWLLEATALLRFGLELVSAPILQPDHHEAHPHCVLAHRLPFPFFLHIIPDLSPHLPHSRHPIFMRGCLRRSFLPRLHLLHHKIQLMRLVATAVCVQDQGDNEENDKKYEREATTILVVVVGWGWRRRRWRTSARSRWIYSAWIPRPG
jgi:hypothetical protein